MSGIGTEIRVFCYAILTGVLIVAVYLWIRVLRRLVAHRLWLINLEDACYWAGISVYTFGKRKRRCRRSWNRKGIYWNS